MSVPFETLIRPIVAQMAADYRIAGGPAAEAMIIAIGLQESRFAVRDQIVSGKAPGAVGPATGYWQFERGGGVRGVMRHPASRTIAQEMAEAAGVAWDEDAIWRVFTRPEGDELACVFARLLLLTDAQALPAAAVGSEEEAWVYYLRNWRPGKPHRQTWGGFWAQAVGMGGQGAVAPVAPPPVAPSVASLVLDVEAALGRLKTALRVA
jgi:hypothetical protein